MNSEGCAWLDTPDELDADEQEIDIAQRSCQESHRTLIGVHENPAGIYKTEDTHLLTNGNKTAQLISAQSITRSETWIAYRIIFLPSLRYSLSSTGFTRQESATILCILLMFFYVPWGVIKIYC
jgi:hypothetical protein